MKNKPKNKIVRPIDIKLPERVSLDGGAMFVILRTLDELETFWREHRKALPFAAESGHWEDDNCLNDYEWVFAPSKVAVVKTVMRWDQMGIKCEWYDWAKAEPDDHKAHFCERDSYRRDRIHEGQWSEDDEKDFQEKRIKRSPETYRGWWKLTNLPCGLDDTDWFSGDVELIDPTLSPEEVAKILQEHTFDDWKECDGYDVRFHDDKSLNEEIAYWRAKQLSGEGYYGHENESRSS